MTLHEKNGRITLNLILAGVCLMLIFSGAVFLYEWSLFSTIEFFINNLEVLATLLAGFIAIVLFYWEQSKKKRDAAKIITQEIRRAEKIISEYKEFGKYKFTRKIVGTNSWQQNIHHFVSELDQDELDKISTLYTTGEYLDLIVARVSDYQFDSRIKNFETQANQAIQLAQPIPLPLTFNSVPNTPVSEEGAPVSQNQGTPVGFEMPMAISLEAPWKILLDEITNKYEPIYHSGIGDKLRKIAKM